MLAHALVLTAAFAGGPEARATLFDAVAGAVRRYHVFSDAAARNLGRSFDDDAPALRAEFAAADGPEALSVALAHLANALHDPHVYFNSPERPEPFEAGLAFDVEWVAGTARWYVSEVNRPGLGDVRVGDLLVSADGVAAADLLEKRLAWSNQNNRRGVAAALATSLGRRARWEQPVEPGSLARFVLSHRGSAGTFAVDAEWRAARDESPPDFALDYGRPPGCRGFPARAYPGYRLVGGGRNFCLYTSNERARRHFPIVRHVSFHYTEPSMGDAAGLAAARDDRELLAAQLGALGHVEGLLLDLRDNQGGNNPNWFLDWYAPRPWVDHYVRTRVHDDLRDPVLRKRFHVDEPWYVYELEAPRAPDGLSRARPFFCPPGSDDRCEWSNRYEPAHRVTRAPVALLVGPRCLSSCDSFAQRFDENDFGPLVGEPTSAGYTTHRVRIPVTLADGTDFGFLAVGFARSHSGLDGAALEAVPLRIDVPVERTFADRDGWDRALVDGAIAALRVGRRSPPPPATRDRPAGGRAGMP